jgi:predicted amidohydrolase YtcJ
MRADLVILRGNVITVDSVRPRVQAIAVKFGRILAVGQDDELRPLVGTDTRVVDAHCHVLPAGRSHFSVNCDPTVVKSIAEIKKAIAEKAKTTPKGEWIVGFGYDDTKMVENRLISFVTISSWDIIVRYRVISILPRIYCKVPPPVIHQLYY